MQNQSSHVPWPTFNLRAYSVRHWQSTKRLMLKLELCFVKKGITATSNTSNTWLKYAHKTYSSSRNALCPNPYRNPRWPTVTVLLSYTDDSSCHWHGYPQTWHRPWRCVCRPSRPRDRVHCQRGNMTEPLYSSHCLAVLAKLSWLGGRLLITELIVFISQVVTSSMKLLLGAKDVSCDALYKKYCFWSWTLKKTTLGCINH